MVCRRRAIRHRVCPKSLRRRGHSDNRTLLRRRVLKRPRRLLHHQRPPSAMLCSSSPLSTVDCADWTPLRFIKVATGSEFSGRNWSLGGRPMHRHRSLPTALCRARAGSRLQPTPAAAPTDQLHHPVPSRLVCRPGSSSLRVGPPRGRQKARNRERA